ncbi:hypothetical protein [Mucilaginibacter ginsenosidivorax]|uniref:MACPF domain-containing protein n=1 Tax=Mucilaginibacter ginsenosidivorax TaxID=862126 RepID=A0A5B8W7M4_9SPHI|nr:hypothetical protein [Mucilaginibacter ginsenosidivorax]QEC78228.1 hypothetical protein FSB76_20630 [Mucilaginibacter ginsenosidivorax]
MTNEENSNLNDIHQYAIATGKNFSVEKGAGAFRGVQTVVNLGLLASPIEWSTIKPSDPASPETRYKVAACTNVYKRDELQRASAEITGSYGAASGSVAASYVKNISISETSSSYVAFFRKSYGRVHLNSDAKLTADAIALLKTNAKQFIAKYGTVYISAYQLTTELYGEVKIDASSMADKVKMDLAVSASYNSLLDAKGSFESDLQRSQAKYNMSVMVNTMGTDISGGSSIKEMAEAVAKIRAQDTPKLAILTEVTLTSWMHLADFAKNVNNEDVKLFDSTITPAQLDLHSANYERVEWMANFTKESIENLDNKLVRQWHLDDKQQRTDKLKEARTFANDWVNKLSKISEEEVAKPDFIRDLSNAIIQVQEDKIVPALKLHPFKFNIKASVASSYDGYSPAMFYTLTVKVDPNEKIAIVETVIDVDNDHSNCRHFHGHLHAKYTDGGQGKDGTVVKPTLAFSNWWDRTCGSTGWSNTVTFDSGTKEKCELNYNDTVRTNIEFELASGKLKQLPSGNEDNVTELAYTY